ncbi:unnamed protein product [Euphydryas editha]|uniref:GIY-YIG homing endonuclease n=1 Tax=Euphydryas editha TaxID=104508 RepID=A0AAU9TKK0_EUPED|nr:unnamed protein product [Euphydryas editha]
MLQTSNIRCYAHDNTGDAFYIGWDNISRTEVEERRLQLVSEIEISLEQVSESSRCKFAQFNPSKIDRSIALSFQNTTLNNNKSIGFLGVNISKKGQYRGHLESKAKPATKNLGVLNRALRYFTSRHRLLLYKSPRGLYVI